MERKIQQYIAQWKQRGYSTGIPDIVPKELENENLAPSYKAVAMAILKNDHYLHTLGFASKKSEWYNVLKRIELRQRGVKLKEFDTQLTLF
jgi:predicted phosphoadenosine phosphosulfate sulfurtransferase